MYLKVPLDISNYTKKLQCQTHWTCNFNSKISHLSNKTGNNFRLQEARLEVLKQLLKKREENHAELNIKRLDKLWSKKQKEKDAKVKKIRNEHIKSELDCSQSGLFWPVKLFANCVTYSIKWDENTPSNYRNFNN